MIGALLLGWGVVAGLEGRRALLIAAALTAPLPLACLLAGHAWRSRHRPSTRPAAFCEAVAGELRAGASLRSALEHAAESVEAGRVAQLCREGRSISEVAAAVRSEFDEIGAETAIVIQHVARLGGPAAQLFDEMAVLALAQIEVSHEIAAATAPARATAFVLTLAPAAAVGWALSERRLDAYLITPTQRASAMIGLGLVVMGVAVAIFILRRSR